MGKFKIGIDFDKKFLKNLTKESDSGVLKQNAKHHLSLHPIHLNNFNKSVKELLSEGIAKYNKNLNGILLGYDNIKLLSNLGVISNDSPYLHYDLLVDFFVFKPEIGKEMKGIVNRKSKDHVGLLVYNAFNVSIPKPYDEDDWLGNSVDVGYEVNFRITFIDLSSYLPYIRGELVSINSEVDNKITSKKTQPLKNKKIVFHVEEEVEEEPAAKKIKVDPEVELEVTHKKSKKKNEKHKAEKVLEELNLSDPKPSITEKKKHKKKKGRVSV